MKITKKIITVKELTENYSDDGDNGVFGLNGKLCIRPEYQRSFVYSDKKRDMVLDTVRKGFPLGLMYWNLKPNGEFECLDGQQRTISISQYEFSSMKTCVTGLRIFLPVPSPSP